MSSVRSFWKSLQRFISNIAPGLFIIGFVIGTGSVTTMVSAGAAYGMSLGWALLLSCFFTGVLLMTINKITMISGHTLMYNLKEQSNKSLTLILVVLLVISAVSSVIGIMGIVASIINEWLTKIIGSESTFPPVYPALALGLALYLLFLFGRHKLFLKAISVVVGLMGLSFIYAMIKVVPDPAEILLGIVPSIPTTGEPMLIIAGMVGTTMAAVVLVSRSILVNEKGWTILDKKKSDRDTIIAMTVTFILSLAIMASAAGTLHAHGIVLDNPVDMVKTLEPFAGKSAITIFVIGIICAGFSSIFPNMVLIPWLICDYLNIPRNMQRPKFRIIALLVVLSGLIIPIYGGKPIVLMIASQAVSPLIMPLFLILLIYLVNNVKLMGKEKAGWFKNLILILTLFFSFYVSIVAFKGFITLIK